MSSHYLRMGSHEGSRDISLSSSGTQSNSPLLVEASSPTYSREQKTESLVEQRNSSQTVDGAGCLATPGCITNVQLRHDAAMPPSNTPEQVPRCQRLQHMRLSRSVDNLSEYVGMSTTNEVDEPQLRNRNYVNTTGPNIVGNQSNQSEIYSYARTPDFGLLPPPPPVRSANENSKLNAGFMHRTGSQPNHLDVDPNLAEVRVEGRTSGTSPIRQEKASHISAAPPNFVQLTRQMSDVAVETAPGIKMSSRSRVFTRQKSSAANTDSSITSSGSHV
jgi:hypothetical protein